MKLRIKWLLVVMLLLAWPGFGISTTEVSAGFDEWSADSFESYNMYATPGAPLWTPGQTTNSSGNWIDVRQGASAFEPGEKLMRIQGSPRTRHNLPQAIPDKDIKVSLDLHISSESENGGMHTVYVENSAYTSTALLTIKDGGIYKPIDNESSFVKLSDYNYDQWYRIELMLKAASGGQKTYEISVTPYGETTMIFSAQSYTNNLGNYKTIKLGNTNVEPGIVQLIDNFRVEAYTPDPLKAVLSGMDQTSIGDPYVLTYGLEHVSSVTEGVYAQDIRISYNPEYFEYVSAITTGTSMIQSVHQDESNIVRFVLSTTLPTVQTVDGSVLSITWLTKAVAGNTAIAVSSATASNPSGIDTSVLAVEKQVQIVVPDKDLLGLALATANHIHTTTTEGIENGNIPPGYGIRLANAITAAQAIYDASSATAAQITEATDQLNEAKIDFEQRIIKALTGDLTENGVISVGDLGVLMKYYGLHSDSPAWNEEATYADFNGDGEIGNFELAFLSGRIVRN